MVNQGGNLLCFVNTRFCALIASNVTFKIYQPSGVLRTTIFNENNGGVYAYGAFTINVVFLRLGDAMNFGGFKGGSLCCHFQVVTFARASGNTRFETSIVASVNCPVLPVVVANVSYCINGETNESVAGCGRQTGQSFFKQRGKETI